MNIKKTWIGLLLVLGLRFGQYYYQLPERVGGEVVTIRGVLGSEPAQANGRQTLSLDGLYVSVRTPPEFHYGDEVMVEGKLLCYDTFRCIRGRIERARVSLVAQDQGGLLTYKTFQRKIKKLHQNKFVNVSKTEGGEMGNTSLISIVEEEKKLSDF